MALQFTRGIEALKTTERGGGDFRPFVPSINWAEGDTKYVLVLNPVEDIPKIFLHDFIQVGTRRRADESTYPVYEEFLDRSRPPINEDEDSLTDLGSVSRERNIAVGVELEPIIETTARGRKRPKGFEVKTREYTRTVLDDDGNRTDEKEEVTAPEIGFITQSPSNWFGWVGSYNETDGPHEDVALRVIRRGGGKDTAYDFTAYEDQPIDLSNLVEFIDGVSYLSDFTDELVEEIEDLEEGDAAQRIASVMLEARLEELADPERYEELTKNIAKIEARWGSGQGKKTYFKDDPEEEDSDSDDSSEEAEEKPKPKRKRATKPKRTATRKRKTTKKESEEPEESSDDDDGEDADTKKKLDEFEQLRAKAKARNKKTS